MISRKSIYAGRKPGGRQECLHYRAFKVALGLLLVSGGTLLAQSLIVSRVTVIDATGAPPKKNVSVEILDGRIVRIERRITAQQGATIIDGKGKYLIPGLWDMHVHISDPSRFFPLFLAAGVTGVREMYSGVHPAAVSQWRSRPDAPLLALPAFIDGPLMLSSGPPAPGAMAVSTPDEARVAVRLLSQSGADFLKVYNSIPREAYFALAEEARAIGIPFVGHAPESVSPREAAEAGQRSEEHLINILLACSTREEELRKARIDTMTTPAFTAVQRFRELGFPKPDELSDTYDRHKAEELFTTFVRTGTWQTPTLALLKGFAYGDQMVQDKRARYMPREWKLAPRPRDKSYMLDLSAEELDALTKRVRDLLERYKKLVGDMHRAGVEFLAGTDVSINNPVMIGFGLHEELALFVESGFTPMEALQTATRNPARYFNRLDQMGTIEVGKIADLVMLDGNPLKDIRNTQKIRAVIERGRYYSRQDLDGMLHVE